MTEDQLRRFRELHPLSSIEAVFASLAQQRSAAVSSLPAQRLEHSSERDSSGRSAS